MNQRIKKILEWTEGPRVLNVGCTGGGEVLNDTSPYWLHRHLAKRFELIVGIDINRAKIEQMRVMGYRCVVGDAQSFSLNEKFDTIVAGELIEHISNPGQFLERAREHIEYGGRVVLTTPFKFPKTCSNPEHTMWFCPTTFSELATRHGFRIVHWELVEDYYTGVPSWKYKLLVALLKVLRPLIPKRLRANCMLFVLEPNMEGGK